MRAKIQSRSKLYLKTCALLFIRKILRKTSLNALVLILKFEPLCHCDYLETEWNFHECFHCISKHVLELLGVPQNTHLFVLSNFSASLAATIKIKDIFAQFIVLYLI